MDTWTDNCGEDIMKGAVVDALENVVKLAGTVLPSWIVLQCLPHQFDWKLRFECMSPVVWCLDRVRRELLSCYLHSWRVC